MAHAFLIKLLLFLVSFSNSLYILYAAMPASSHLSFSLTHRDAESSPLRSLEADPADLPEDMPLRAFVAAGRALRARLNSKREQLMNAKHGGPRPAAVLRAAVSYGGELVGDFYTTVSVGTPPQKMIFLLDTGSELNWVQCSPCSNCTATTAPRFAYKKSSSFRAVGCDSPLCHYSVGFRLVPGCNVPAAGPAGSCLFNVTYGDNSMDVGFLSVDSFELGPQFSKPFVFGCAVIVEETVSLNNSGILGLDAGPFSFTSQLFSGSPRGVPKKFAYCLPDRFESLNVPGTIEFGNYKPPTGMRYTPFAPPYSPLGDIYYYVKLQGVTVGKSLIKVDNMGANGVVGAGGTLFDSGTVLSHLIKPLYDKLVGEMMRQTVHLGPFNASKTELKSDLCYKQSAKTEELPKVPRVSIHFAGGVDLELGPTSILYANLLRGDNANIYFCLAFLMSTDDQNIIGNYQQQNYWVEYNLDTSSLGLAKANCAHS